MGLRKLGPHWPLQGALFFNLLNFLYLTNTEPFAAWFVVTGDATPDGIRVVQSIFKAIGSLSIVAFRYDIPGQILFEKQRVRMGPHWPLQGAPTPLGQPYDPRDSPTVGS